MKFGFEYGEIVKLMLLIAGTSVMLGMVSST